MKHFSLALAALCAAAISPLAHGSCLPLLIKSVKLQQTTGAYLHLFELQILDPTGANIVLGKTASQSSVHIVSDVVGGYGIHAIDGNMTSFLHTGSSGSGDPNPWLNIDLGASYDVEKIVIHNRWCNDPSDVQNQCYCRMSQANLLLYDNSGAFVSSFSVGNTCGKATLSYSFCLPARSFKISASGDNSLELVEVQAFDTAGLNRALGSSGAIASQSSTYNWGGITPCPASIANDGNTVEHVDGSATCNGIAATNAGPNAWWQVDMQNPYKISRVVIYNRPSSPIRLSHAAVSLLDIYGNVMARVTDIGDTTNVPIVSLNSGDFSLILPKAKFLKIALPRNGVIHIYEAQVFDSTGTNRALASSGAVASQSSTYSWSGITPCHASIAIDGRTVQDVSRPCDGLSHTLGGLYAWWQVEMPDKFSISRVVIYNRIILQANLANAAVALMDEYENVIGLVANIGDTQGKNVITLNSGEFSGVNSACRDRIEQIRGVWCSQAGSKINIARCGGVDIWNPATHLECTDTQNQYWSMRCSDGTYGILC
jgi:hypothetical protein